MDADSLQALRPPAHRRPSGAGARVSEASTLQACGTLGVVTTKLRHVFYTAAPSTWWTYTDIVATHMERCHTENGAGCCQPHLAPPVFGPPRINDAICWQTNLFVALATRIIRQLAGEVRRRKTIRVQAGNLHMPLFAANELLVYVGFPLQRLMGPFQLVLEGCLSSPAFRQQIDLEGIMLEHVSCHMANDSAGPTFLYGHVIRHPRYRKMSADRFADGGHQRHGLQAQTSLQHIQLTRASHEMVIWPHDEPVGTPSLPRQLRKDAAPCYQRLVTHRNLAGKYGQWMPLDCGHAHAVLHTEVFGETGWPEQFLVARAVHDVAMWLLTN